MDDTTAEALLGFVSDFSTDGTPGMFRPAVILDDDGSAFDWVLTRSGRDPR